MWGDQLCNFTLWSLGIVGGMVIIYVLGCCFVDFFDLDGN